jgi:glycosyltransferase involved in cell wall biosynthesis
MAPTVAIDARAAVRAEIGGVERVAREMVRRLPALQPDRYRVAAPPRALAHRAGQLWEQVALPLTARDAALVYCPANLAPLAVRRTVVVIHDVAALRHPEWYSRAYAAYQRRVLPAIVRRAAAVVTVSEFSRGELAAVLGLDPRGVAVVPNGVDAHVFTPEADPAPARAAHGLDSPYALAVGTRIARKNAAALRSARDRLAELGVELVLAGSGRSYMRAGEEPPARAVGYVDDALLPGLYAGAEALLMPSLYEGFGLPCLEAMACRTPVVAADRAALPETCAGAAILVDPDDPDALAEAAVTAVADTARRARLREAGRARAAQLSWDRAARATDELIAGLLERSRRAVASRDES